MIVWVVRHVKFSQKITTNILLYLVKASIYPRTISRTSTASLNEYSLPTESTDEIRSHPQDRVNFIHDVHPKQRDHYLTSKFKIPDGSTTQKFKGGISYIQGAKTEEEIKNKAAVFPQIHVSFYNELK
jgi:hypothetical protein